MIEEEEFHPTVVEIHAVYDVIFRGFIASSVFRKLLSKFGSTGDVSWNVILYVTNPVSDKKEPKVSLRREDIRFIGDTFGLDCD